MTQSKSRPFSAEIHFVKQAGGAANIAGDASPSGQRPAAFGGQAEILAAIAGLREELLQKSAGPQGMEEAGDKNPMVTDEALQAHGRDVEDAKKLKSELDQLTAAIDTTKREIASMRYKDANKYERIIDVTHELDEVVLDTERATESILSCCEDIEKHIDVISLQASSADERAEIEALSEKVVNIYEACNFQDITGQRINKVVNTLKFIEERLEVMMAIWGGRDSFSGIDVPDREVGHEDELLLNGPARSDDAQVSQDDIDALFD